MRSLPFTVGLCRVCPLPPSLLPPRKGPVVASRGRVGAGRGEGNWAGGGRFPPVAEGPREGVEAGRRGGMGSTKELGEREGVDAGAEGGKREGARG